MTRLFAALIALFMPLPAFSLCNGDGFETYLSATDLADIDAAVAATPYGAGIFWEAQKDGVTLSILGTMHLPDPRHNMLMFNANDRLVAADLLLVEATLQDQADMQTFMAENPDMLVIGDGPSLPDLLDEPTWNAIRTAAQQRGVPGFMAAKMQPWFLLMTISIPTCAAAEMIAGVGGLDAMLMEQAALFDVPTEPLEPWQDMLDLMRAGTFEEQVDALRLGLMDPDISDALMVSLVNGYFDGQTARAWQMTYYTLNFLPDIDQAVFDEQMAMMEDLLLEQRNAKWIPVIEGAAGRHENIFLAFGAAHLFGETGVLQLLENEGWAISPL